MIQQWNELLATFGRLPKPNINPAFMDICRMGGDRFEERCSQVLKFYFSPNGPHKLRGLFLDSLLEWLGVPSDYDPGKVRVLTEETTEDGKRIDITITSEKFVVAIENKIEAELYNPLESYAKHINQNYENKVKKLVVLSVRKITDAKTKEEMEEHGFVYLNYQDLFSTIKTNLGKYAIDCDQTYLTFLFDFIRTIEKKFNYSTYSTTMEQDSFFFLKQPAIDELIQYYNSFKDAFAKKRFDAQKGPIDEIKTEILARTNANWEAWEGWDLVIKFNKESNCIGIECNFGDATLDNPLGKKFYIYITVWDKKCFTPYEERLKSKFPNAKVEYENDRISLRLQSIDSNKHTEIIEKLEEYYKIMKELTDEIK